jgi:hypothetical protein
MVAGPKTQLMLQRYTRNNGTKAEGWSDIRIIKGVLTDVSGRESILLGQFGIKADHQFVCNKQKGITITLEDRFRSDLKASSDKAIYYKVKRIVDNQTFLSLTLETGTGKNVG